MHPKGRQTTCCQWRFSLTLAMARGCLPAPRAQEPHVGSRLGQQQEVSALNLCCWRCCKTVGGCWWCGPCLLLLSLVGLEVTQIARGFRHGYSWPWQRWMDLLRGVASETLSRCFWCYPWCTWGLTLAACVFLWSWELVWHANDNEGGNKLSLEMHLCQFLTLNSNTILVIQSFFCVTISWAKCFVKGKWGLPNVTGQECKAAFHCRAHSWVERLRYNVIQNSSKGFASLILRPTEVHLLLICKFWKILSEARDLV